MRWILLVALIAVPTACQVERPIVSHVKDRIVSRLFDPESAEFRNIKVEEDGQRVTVCGEINAKNRYGGLTGFQAFAFVRSPVEDTGRTVDSLWMQENEKDDYFVRVWGKHCHDLYQKDA